jgi:primosomal protein N'
MARRSGKTALMLELVREQERQGKRVLVLSPNQEAMSELLRRYDATSDEPEAESE